jgi:DNA-binding NarL/FixJ family response regulator
MSISPNFLVVEDDELVGRAFASVLGERWTTAWARTVGAAREAIATKRYSGIVLDGGLPDGLGLDFLSELRARSDRTPCLFVSGQFDPSLATRCHALDAWCVFKPEVLDDVLVFAERSAAVATSIAESSRAVVDDYSAVARLSARETEILRLVLEGTPRSGLAPELGMSENSIKTLVRRLLRKVDASNLDEVARRVLEEVLRRERVAS